MFRRLMLLAAAIGSLAGCSVMPQTEPVFIGEGKFGYRLAAYVDTDDEPAVRRYIEKKGRQACKGDFDILHISRAMEKRLLTGEYYLNVVIACKG